MDLPISLAEAPFHLPHSPDQLESARDLIRHHRKLDTVWDLTHTLSLAPGIVFLDVDGNVTLGACAWAWFNIHGGSNWAWFDIHGG